ncbi:PIR Superfamily Protein [Plasmodium ovale wallikeri]|uniref:PIR Superfamily Protein n=1 Tax=Plasmodium ovale wallikeri TaxID=864142 RepID=A0A1A9AH01_PLAOA|nr:PIR Superfamily Protein [Plasmodium ovale wallikeri]
MDELLAESPAYKIYKEFNDITAVHDHDNHFQETLQLVSNDSNIKNLIGKLVGNLTTNPNIIKVHRNKKEYCAHLHFWLCDQILKNNGTYNKGDTELMEIINSIFNGWRNFIRTSSTANCSCRYSSKATLENWREGKIFHDYFKNFEYINTNYSPNNKKCQEYHKYVEHINQYFVKYKSRCHNDIMAPCTYDNDLINIYNPNDKLSKVTCNDQSSSSKLMGTGPAEIGEQTEFPASHMASHLEDGQNDNTSASSVYYSVVPVSVTVLGISVLFYVFYRLTPIGHWLRRHLLRKRINEHNVYEEDTIEPITNTYNIENSDYISSIHNLGYQPLKDQ